jgi:hypothetical protein
LKISNNRISSLDDVKQLQVLTNLVQLELQDNDVANTENFRSTIYEILPSVSILDMKDKDNQSFYSDDFEDMEEGEHEQGLAQLIENLDPETREKFEKGELNEEDLIGMGLLDGDDQYSFDDAGSEEGEADQSGEES